MGTSRLSKAQTLTIAALPLSLIACTLAPWLAPYAAPSDIQLANEAVLATNAAIEAAIAATETAAAGQVQSQEPTETPKPKATHTPTPASAPPLTHTPTVDPCTGWPCVVRGIVYVDRVESGNALEGASVTLRQSSYCSPTRGEYQIATGPDGRFEFGQVFFHDTDRIWIQVEAEGYESTRWDSAGFYCLYCSCFGSPIEFVLRTAPGQ